MLRHIATLWPNTRNMLLPTMLGYVVIVWLGLYILCSILTGRDWPLVGLIKNTGTSKLGYLVSRRAWLAAGLSICRLSIKLAMRMG